MQIYHQHRVVIVIVYGEDIVNVNYSDIANDNYGVNVDVNYNVNINGSVNDNFNDGVNAKFTETPQYAAGQLRRMSMFVITFANPKGGSGKTTAAMLLAEQIHHAGASVTLLDCDPNQNIVQWASMRREDRRSCPFAIEPVPSEETMLEKIEALSDKTDYLVIDLEGTASQIVTYAVSQSDLVLIPFEPTPMEARQAARAVQLVGNASRMLKKKIPHSLLLTRVNAAFQTSDEKDVRTETDRTEVSVLNTKIVRRAPYTRIFREGKMLSELLEDAKEETVGRTDSQQQRLLRPIENAIVNARVYAQEVVRNLNIEEAAA